MADVGWPLNESTAGPLRRVHFGGALAEGWPISNERRPQQAPAWIHPSGFGMVKAGYESVYGFLHRQQKWSGGGSQAHQGQAICPQQQLGRRSAEGHDRKRLPEGALVEGILGVVPRADRWRHRRDQGTIRVRLR